MLGTEEQVSFCHHQIERDGPLLDLGQKHGLGGLQKAASGARSGQALGSWCPERGVADAGEASRALESPDTRWDPTLAACSGTGRCPEEAGAQQGMGHFELLRCPQSLSPCHTLAIYPAPMTSHFLMRKMGAVRWVRCGPGPLLLG